MWQGCPLHPRDTPGTHFCWRLSRPQGHSAAGRIKTKKNSNNSIGNWTSDLPACSEVPQPTAPLRASPPPILTKIYVIFLSSPNYWCHNIIRPRHHSSKSCSLHQQLVPSSGQHPSFWRHLRPITARLISVHLSGDAYSTAIWAFSLGAPRGLRYILACYSESKHRRR
jgi:hypothetical protein